MRTSQIFLASAFLFAQGYTDTSTPQHLSSRETPSGPPGNFSFAAYPVNEPLGVSRNETWSLSVEVRQDISYRTAKPILSSMVNINRPNAPDITNLTEFAVYAGGLRWGTCIYYLPELFDKLHLSKDQIEADDGSCSTILSNRCHFEILKHIMDVADSGTIQQYCNLTSRGSWILKEYVSAEFCPELFDASQVNTTISGSLYNGDWTGKVFDDYVDINSSYTLETATADITQKILPMVVIESYNQGGFSTANFVCLRATSVFNETGTGPAVSHTSLTAAAAAATTATMLPAGTSTAAPAATQTNAGVGAEAMIRVARTALSYSGVLGLYLAII